MASAATIRAQVEAVLERHTPSALTSRPRTVRPVSCVGIPAVDTTLQGGLPVGAITEVIGPECSGRTSFALSFTAEMTAAIKACAWVDVSDTFHPESAAAMGVDMTRLLWVRCGLRGQSAPASTSTSTFEDRPSTAALSSDVFGAQQCSVPSPFKQGLPTGGFGPHPRSEARGLAQAIGGLLGTEAISARCAEPVRRPRAEGALPSLTAAPAMAPPVGRGSSPSAPKLWSRMEQALRVTDLLLQAGGFSAIVLDLSSLAPESVSRIPLATWFRYRAAAERTQACVLLLTQHACAKSSAGLVLRLDPAIALCEEPTVFTGLQHRVQVARQRFPQTPTNVIALRKPVQRETGASWQSHLPWAGRP